MNRGGGWRIGNGIFLILKRDMLINERTGECGTCAGVSLGQGRECDGMGRAHMAAWALSIGGIDR